MRKVVVLFLIFVFIGSVSATEFNQFRPEGEISNNEVTFWGEVVSEEPGKLNLYVNNEIVHTGQHNGGRSDFPAGYTQEFSNGNYTWFIELDGEQVERSNRMNFSIGSPIFLDFEHRENRTFDIGSSSGELKLFINDNEVVSRNLSSPYTDTVNLSLESGNYSYYASLDTGDQVLETEKANISIGASASENHDHGHDNGIEAEFEESVGNNTVDDQESQPQENGIFPEFNLYPVYAAGILIMLFLALFIKRSKLRKIAGMT